MGTCGCPLIWNESTVSQATKGPLLGPRCLWICRHALTTGAASSRRRIGWKWSGGKREGEREREKKKTSPVRNMQGSSFQTLRQPGLFNRLSVPVWTHTTHTYTQRWQGRDEDVAHLRRAPRRAFNTGLILDSMYLHFLSSDELAPVVDSNSSRDSTGGMEERFFLLLLF